MRLINFASGSSGNATYIGTDKTHILLDAGISRKRICDGLGLAGVALNEVSGIFITHEHADHIGSLGVLLRKAEIPVFATKETIREIKKNKLLGNYNRDVFVEIEPDIDVTVGDIRIKPLRVSHDAMNPVCYRFEDVNTEKTAAVVTDLGQYDDYLLDNLKNTGVLMLEANHDVRMLQAGSYPYALKRRIEGRRGHLSNEDSGKFLSKLLHDGIKEIMLAHVSRENNTRELARISVEAEIDLAENKYKSADFDIRVARHDEISDILEA